jgi:hypothetical protein
MAEGKQPRHREVDEAHKKLLEGENFKVVARGKKYQVVDYEKYLMKLT